MKQSAEKVKNIGSWINGKEITEGGRAQNEVRNPYDNEVIGIVNMATLDDLEAAIVSSHRAFEEAMKSMPAHQRSDILRKAADELEASKEEFAATISQETGKTIRDSRGEVSRAIQLLRFASSEAKANDGELIKMDASTGGENRLGFVKRYPVGVVAAITPFNYPLNLAMHKIAPAIATGCSVVVKPAGKTPLSTAMLAPLFERAGLPKGALNIVMGAGAEIGEALVTHPYIKKVTFTGSESVGMKLKELAGDKKVTLELGSNAPNIIFEDANLEMAVSNILRGAFTYSGQACISAQRIYVQKGVYEKVMDLFVPKVEKLVVGDPASEQTDIGPLITLNAAERVEQWVQEASNEGARIIVGGKREGAIYHPTIVENVKSDMKVVCQEIFGPVVVMIPFEKEEEVVSMANDSNYGLQAAVFTSDVTKGLRIADQLETGGVWINEVSQFRLDHYPYGGVKKSGLGKEGVKYAMDDMTEMKFIGVNLI
ncbi:aldehyde dehydrogenase family protein [Halalkalibacter oceani]|uniref:aldehyde dehydrogenase family protein n=1 Tax=Halalkalibacter oceani TaxID=1653776 RepID=UPI003395DC89